MVASASKPRPVPTSATTVPFPASTTATSSSPLTPSSSHSTTSTWTSYSATTSHGSPPQSTDPDTAVTPSINTTVTPSVYPVAPAQPCGGASPDLSVSTGPHHSRWFQTKLHTPPHSPIDVGSWTTSTATTNTSSSATSSTLNVLRTRSPSAPNPLNHTYTTTSVLTGHVPGRSTSSAPSTRATSGFPWPIAPQHYEARPYPEARSYPEYFDQSAFTQLVYHPSEYLHGQGDGPFGQPTTSRGSARIPVTPLARHHSQPNLHSHAPPSNGRPLSYVHESDEASASSSGSDAGYGAGRLASKSMSDVHQTSSGKNVWIATVKPEATEDLLKSCASQFGEVYSCRIQAVGRTPLALHPNGTGYQETPQRRCAFVLYKTSEQAAGFIRYLRGLGIPCDAAKDDFQTEWKVREDRASANLYIQGLPHIVTVEDLHELLRLYGIILSCKFLESSDGRSRRGPVLARLECRAQADAAIKGLNGKPYKGDEQHILVVRIADSTEQKEFKQRTQMMLNAPHSAGATALGRDGLHRPSIPDGRAIAAERATIRAAKERLQLALAELEAEEERLAARCAPRPYSPQRLFQMPSPASNGYDSYMTPPRSSTGHHHPSVSTMRSDRSWASSTYGGDIWSPAGHATSASVSHGESDNVRRVRFDVNLHHARSTPDLGKAEEGVRLLWKDADRGQ